MGLQINQNKTKFMPTTSRSRAGNAEENLSTEEKTFETVREFVYLGTLVNPNNDTSEEIKRRIITANKTYYSLAKHLSNKSISRSTKIRLYKTLIIPVVTYGSEAWTLTKSDETALLIFERKVLRKIFGAVCENGVWRRRYNYELHNMYRNNYNGKDIVTEIKLSRLRWAGHVARAQENNLIKRVFTAEPVGSRKQGRPKRRWTDGVSADARNIGAPNWRNQSQNRTEWRKKLKKVMVLQKL